MRRCPFCGEKIPTDAEQCEHCGKTLVKRQEESEGNPRLVSIDSWEGKRVPAWVMYLVIAMGLLCLWLFLTHGCGDQSEVQPNGESALRFQLHAPIQIATVSKPCDRMTISAKIALIDSPSNRFAIQLGQVVCNLNQTNSLSSSFPVVGAIKCVT